MHFKPKLWFLSAPYRNPRYDIAVDLEPAGNSTDVTIVVNTKARMVAGAFSLLLLIVLIVFLVTFEGFPTWESFVIPPWGALVILALGVPFTVWITYIDCVLGGRLAFGRLQRGVLKLNAQQATAISSGADLS